MMIVYDRFWEMLNKKGITQYTVVHKYKISGSTLQRIRKNGNLWMTTIAKLCDVLDCNIEDVMEFKPDEDISDKMLFTPLARVRPKAPSSE